LKAIESSEGTNLKEQYNEAMNQFDPMQKQSMLQQVKLEQQQLTIIKDLIAIYNK